jgi:hypothetical protein
MPPPTSERSPFAVTPDVPQATTPVTGTARRLPAWVTWQRRPFPDANLLLLGGPEPALVDSG